MKDDKSSVMKDDKWSSAEDARDDDGYNGAQQRNQRSPRLHRKSPSPQPDSSSDEEEEEERRSSRRREKTRGGMQVESLDFPVQNGELTQSRNFPVHNGELTQSRPIQTADTSRRQKVGDVMQGEPLDFPVQNGELMQSRDFPAQNGELTQSRPVQTAYSPRRQKNGNATQVEPPDFPDQNGELMQSRPVQTTCAPPNMAAQQEEEDNGRQERRKKSSLDAVAHTTVDASARSVSGRGTTQRAEERTAMEQELSALQLIPEKDLQSPTITSRQKGCHITTEAVIEQEPRGKSSAMETSDQASLDVVKPEIVEQLQRLTASQGTEIQQLRKLAADLDQRLTSGFYPTPYVGQGRPPTPGVTAGPAIQKPVRYGDAYGAYHNRSGFYSPPGYALCVQPNEYRILHFRKFNAFVARIMRHTLVQMVCHTPLRKQKCDNSTKSYLYSSRLTVFPDNQKWMEDQRRGSL